MASKTITVTKVDQVAEKPKVEEKKPEPLPKMVSKKTNKSMKTFPRIATMNCSTILVCCSTVPCRTG